MDDPLCYNELETQGPPLSDYMVVRTYGGGKSGAIIFEIQHHTSSDEEPMVLKIFTDAYNEHGEQDSERPHREISTICRLSGKPGYTKLVSSGKVDATELREALKSSLGRNPDDEGRTKIQKQISKLPENKLVAWMITSKANGTELLKLDLVKHDKFLLGGLMQIIACYTTAVNTIGDGFGHYDFHPDNIFVDVSNAKRALSMRPIADSLRDVALAGLMRVLEAIDKMDSHGSRDAQAARLLLDQIKNFFKEEARLYTASSMYMTPSEFLDTSMDRLHKTIPPARFSDESVYNMIERIAKSYLHISLNSQLHFPTVTVIDFDLASGAKYKPSLPEHHQKLNGPIPVTERTIAFLLRWIPAQTVYEFLRVIKKVTSRVSETKRGDVAHILTYAFVMISVHLRNKRMDDSDPLHAIHKSSKKVLKRMRSIRNAERFVTDPLPAILQLLLFETSTVMANTIDAQLIATKVLDSFDGNGDGGALATVTEFIQQANDIRRIITLDLYIVQKLIDDYMTGDLMIGPVHQVVTRLGRRYAANLWKSGKQQKGSGNEDPLRASYNQDNSALVIKIKSDIDMFTEVTMPNQQVMQHIIDTYTTLSVNFDMDAYATALEYPDYATLSKEYASFLSALAEDTNDDRFSQESAELQGGGYISQFLSRFIGSSSRERESLPEAIAATFACKLNEFEIAIQAPAGELIVEMRPTEEKPILEVSLGFAYDKVPLQTQPQRIQEEPEPPQNRERVYDAQQREPDISDTWITSKPFVVHKRDENGSRYLDVTRRDLSAFTIKLNQFDIKNQDGGFHIAGNVTVILGQGMSTVMSLLRMIMVQSTMERIFMSTATSVLSTLFHAVNNVLGIWNIVVSLLFQEPSSMADVLTMVIRLIQKYGLQSGMEFESDKEILIIRYNSEPVDLECKLEAIRSDNTFELRCDFTIITKPADLPACFSARQDLQSALDCAIDPLGGVGLPDFVNPILQSLFDEPYKNLYDILTNSGKTLFEVAKLMCDDPTQVPGCTDENTNRILLKRLMMDGLLHMFSESVDPKNIKVSLGLSQIKCTGKRDKGCANKGDLIVQPLFERKFDDSSRVPSYVSVAVTNIDVTHMMMTLLRNYLISAVSAQMQSNNDNNWNSVLKSFNDMLDREKWTDQWWYLQSVPNQLRDIAGVKSSANGYCRVMLALLHEDYRTRDSRLESAPFARTYCQYALTSLGVMAIAKASDTGTLSVPFSECVVLDDVPFDAPVVDAVKSAKGMLDFVNSFVDLTTYDPISCGREIAQSRLADAQKHAERLATQHQRPQTLELEQYSAKKADAILQALDDHDALIRDMHTAAVAAQVALETVLADGSLTDGLLTDGSDDKWWIACPYTQLILMRRLRGQKVRRSVADIMLQSTMDQMLLITNIVLTKEQLAPSDTGSQLKIELQEVASALRHTVIADVVNTNAGARSIDPVDRDFEYEYRSGGARTPVFMNETPQGGSRFGAPVFIEGGAEDEV